MTTRDALFLSYSKADEEFALDLYSAFQAANVSPFAFGEGRPGDVWMTQIEQALKTSKVLLCIMTPNSLNSRWVHAEIGAAWAQGITIIPALRKGVSAEQLIQIASGTNAVDMSDLEKERVSFTKIMQEYFNDARPAPPGRGEGLTEAPISALRPFGDWRQDSKRMIGSGMYSYLLSASSYRAPFRIYATMRFDEFRPEGGSRKVNAGLVLGWKSVNQRRRHYNFCMSEEPLGGPGTGSHLELIGDRGIDEYHDFKAIGDDRDFHLLSNVEYKFEARVDATRMDLAISSERDPAGKRMSFDLPEHIEGRVGVRPWRSRVTVSNFDVIQG